MTINVGIIGASGYTGEELIKVLSNHPEARVTALYNTSDKPDMNQIRQKCGLVFLATPHTVSMQFVPKLLELGKKIIDLSADYRLKDTRVYEKFYQAKQIDKVNLAGAVYGLPEFYRAKIKTAKLVANPGCYPTAAILALGPLVSLGLIEPGSIIIDAKSGASGAGKRISKEYLFLEVHDDFRAYKVGVHQHTPEINQALSRLAGKKLNVTFVPHLLPINRGILETIYVKKAQSPGHKAQGLVSLYKKFYKNEPFIRIRNEGEFPRIKDVAGTNFCEIGIKEDGGLVIIIVAIDNLLKGAAGQAVQNMNIMCKFPETMGLA